MTLTIAFGSCNRSTRSQKFWDVIAKDKPDYWIWLGDIIYGDGLDMVERAERYAELEHNPHYSAFREKTKVIGTWDDHDFASNNVQGSYVGKALSKALIQVFLGIPSDRHRDDGIYQSYAVDRTKIILLDLRYNMDKKRGVLLGAKQWQWLYKEVMDLDFDFLIIGSSQNVLSPYGAHCWEKFPNEASQLRLLLSRVPETKPKLILTGDKHCADISVRRGIVQAMSSGLTHSRFFVRSNPYAIGKVIKKRNYGLIKIADGRARIEIKSPEDGRVFQAFDMKAA